MNEKENFEKRVRDVIKKNLGHEENNATLINLLLSYVTKFPEKDDLVGVIADIIFNGANSTNRQQEQLIKNL